jgi:hypothetical protein
LAIRVIGALQDIPPGGFDNDSAYVPDFTIKVLPGERHDKAEVIVSLGVDSDLACEQEWESLPFLPA